MKHRLSLTIRRADQNCQQLKLRLIHIGCGAARQRTVSQRSAQRHTASGFKEP